MSAPPVEVVSFGCRMNHVESETLAREARAQGAVKTVIVNTCAVTAEAVRQARQSVRRIARERPDARILVTGCAVEAQPGDFSTLAGVARIIGNARKSVASNDGIGFATPIAQRALGASEGTRGFLAVQNGCDHSCTFCVIPLGRGPSRSAPVAEVLREARRLVEDGKREIVLTGVDLTSYDADGATLASLVKSILRELPQLERLRLSSIDCIEAGARLIEAMAEDSRLMPHLHLSLQSGDDLILKRMKRRHSRDDAVRFCQTLRAARPEIAFGADMIVGFPTESDAMFERSLSLIDDCGLAYLHVFPFSPRPQTAAARMPQLPRDVVKERARLLREAGARALARHLDAKIGKTVRVLTERGGFARAEDFTRARTPDAAPGVMLDMRVEEHDGESLRGVVNDLDVSENDKSVNASATP